MSDLKARAWPAIWPSSTIFPARVFTAARARQGYHINQFCMSLMKPENRDLWRADERAYLDKWPISEEAKQADAGARLQPLLDLGGNIYFLSKIFSTDGIPFAEACSTMTAHELARISPDDAGWRAAARRAALDQGGY
jgi:protocatechuate 4,5-dioxygenase alpha subunit